MKIETILWLLNRTEESISRGTKRVDYATEFNTVGNRCWGCRTHRADHGKDNAWRSFQFDLWAYTVYIDIAVKSRVAAARQIDIIEGAI